ncbi:timeless isoform X2 [Leptinotarsa decemlineata]|uniref:timeless isoform X2 n=1 Tax=Leptinotarsa decemlineata TaxID=7539 RepID=UPI003D3078C4
MAWVTSNSVHTIFTSLFVQNGDAFIVNDDCLAILEEILRNLTSEDVNLRTFRRAIGFGQNIRKNLIPLLLYVRDDAQIKDATKIIDTTIKIFVNLTIPVEYLLPIEAVSCTEVGKHTVFELNKLLTSSKEIFTDGRNTKALVDHMKYLVESDSQLDLEQCDSINNCLLLLRNILHIPESKSPTSIGSVSSFSMQNQIIWNLFTQSLDKIIIYLMSCAQKMYWGVTMVQLIALMYKDQHVGNLQKLLNLWLEASYSDSSEDNESNTSPPEQGSDDSSPVITSDPTSDSSDNGNYTNMHSNGGNKAIVNSERTLCSTDGMVRAVQNRSKSLADMKKNSSIETETSTSSGVSSMGHSMESNDPPSETSHSGTLNAKGEKISIRPSSQSEISDCGYMTQVENQESISTSSNDDDQPLQKPMHQKPHTFQKTRFTPNKNRATTALEKKELRRKKLVKRRKTNIINMKGLLHHLPTDEDIANILKEFTVDFLLKCYGTLVNDLHSHLLTNIHIQIDTSHFFWLVTYFLKFATQLELDPEHISPVLSYEILSYLIFQGVWVYEELEISCRIPEIDLKPCLRRLHLVVTAIREFLQGVESYQKMFHLNDADKDHLATLQKQIGEMENLKMLFVLLLRQYNPSIQSRQYLQDLILTNHNFLLFLENYSVVQNHQCGLVDHLKQFATVDIMRQYGLLLESFKENGEFVNNCIFTMMHHIGGDLQNVSSLFQPSILKTFSQIWETDYELCDDWSDLIEYVIHKFINNPSSHCVDSANTSLTTENPHKDSKEVEHFSHSEYSQPEWTREEKENLIKYYNQSRESSDAIAKITEKYEESGMRYKTPHAVIHELLEQNIITENEYNDLTKNKIERFDSDEKIFENFSMDNTKSDHPIDNDIKVLREFLFKENKGKFLMWLQTSLLEACYVKLVLNDPDEFPDNKMEPTVYYSALLGLPIPVIPWTCDQANILKHQPFVLLLHKLGFYLPAETGKIFVRIPNFWTADYIFNIAQQLGPIQTDKLKFDVNKLKSISECRHPDIKSTISSTFFDSTRFSMIELKQTPSVVRYTPFSRKLSIVIPDADVIPCNISPPGLCIVERSGLYPKKDPLGNMECSNSHDTDLDDMERNSNCDTASVASDLTRMCVSDEEDKVILVINKAEKNS